MWKLQMIGHVLVAYEARLSRGAGQRGNQRVRKPVVAPRSHFEIADGVIVKRQAARLNLFSALGAGRLVGCNKEADLLFLHNGLGLQTVGSLIRGVSDSSCR